MKEEKDLLIPKFIFSFMKYKKKKMLLRRHRRHTTQELGSASILMKALCKYHSMCSVR